MLHTCPHTGHTEQSNRARMRPPFHSSSRAHVRIFPASDCTRVHTQATQSGWSRMQPPLHSQEMAGLVSAGAAKRNLQMQCLERHACQQAGPHLSRSAACVPHASNTEHAEWLVMHAASHALMRILPASDSTRASTCFFARRQHRASRVAGRTCGLPPRSGRPRVWWSSPVQAWPGCVCG